MKKTQAIVYAMIGLAVLACIVSILVLMHTGLSGFIPHSVPLWVS